MISWSLCTHFDVNCSFWRFWNAASFNLVLTSLVCQLPFECIITYESSCISLLLRGFYGRNHGLIDHSFVQCSQIPWFHFCFFYKNKFAGWSCIQWRSCNIDTSRFFLSQGGGKQSPVPFRHRVSIATATDRERGVGFGRTRTRRAFAADSLRWPRPVRKKKDFEREFDGLVGFNFAFRWSCAFF